MLDRYFKENKYALLFLFIFLSSFVPVFLSSFLQEFSSLCLFALRCRNKRPYKRDYVIIIII